MPTPVHDALAVQVQASLGSAYTLGRELGGGGMSRVFVAREEALGRDVVVKVLAPELSEGLSAERFAREIKLVAALQEPHIVPILTAGVTAGGLPFYTMPLVSGESLRARIARGAVQPAEAVAILRDVARALAYAHGRGIVHRDVKPDNVLLSSGTAVVLDFGIAKALSAAKTRAPDDAAGTSTTGTLTQRGVSLGTPAYMAPEQAAGDAVDPRADLYAWGMVAYELLAGRHPFAGRTTAQQLMAAHLAEAPRPLQEVTPAIPPALAALVMRCLAKEPAARPADAAQVLAALDGIPVATGPQPVVPPEASSPWPERRASQLALAALAVAVLVGGAWAWRTRASSAVVSESGDPPVVAVLPFEMASHGAGALPDSAFADGLGDAITGKLARLAGLRVIDRASVRSVADAAVRPQAAGRVLGADYVLRATLRWARGADERAMVQVSPVLVRVADGTTFWAGEPQVVSPADPFTVQGVLATAVADALDVALAPGERTRLVARATRDTAVFAAVERGRRALADVSLSPPERFARALPEFEFAYGRDPEDAAAWGLAADVLHRMGRRTGSLALVDSAAVLARRALALDPGNLDAVNARIVADAMHGRMAAQRSVVEAAVRANPSSAELRMLLALVAQQSGDSAAVWPEAREAIQLAPRSEPVLRQAFRVAVEQRGYADAYEVLARWRALNPASADLESAAAMLAAFSGDSAAVGRALRAYREKGGRLLASDYGPLAPFQMMRYADRAFGDELAVGTPATFGATTGVDTLRVYIEQAQLLWTRGDSAPALTLVDRGFAIARRLHAAEDLAPHEASSWYLTWFAAARGDSAVARATLAAYAASAQDEVASLPGGLADAGLTCMRAEVAALLGDVAEMLAPLERCLTMANGYPVTYLETEPSFARHRRDPRVRALATKLAGAAARARSAPMGAAR